MLRDWAFRYCFPLRDVRHNFKSAVQTQPPNIAAVYRESRYDIQHCWFSVPSETVFAVRSPLKNCWQCEQIIDLIISVLRHFYVLMCNYIFSSIQLHHKSPLLTGVTSLQVVICRSDSTIRFCSSYIIFTILIT